MKARLDQPVDQLWWPMNQLRIDTHHQQQGFPFTVGFKIDPGFVINGVRHTHRVAYRWKGSPEADYSHIAAHGVACGR